MYAEVERRITRVRRCTVSIIIIIIIIITIIVVVD